MRGDKHVFRKNGSKIFLSKGLDTFLIKRSNLPVGLSFPDSSAAIRNRPDNAPGPASVRRLPVETRYYGANATSNLTGQNYVSVFKGDDHAQTNQRPSRQTGYRHS